MLWTSISFVVLLQIFQFCHAQPHVTVLSEKIRDDLREYLNTRGPSVVRVKRSVVDQLSKAGGTSASKVSNLILPSSQLDKMNAKHHFKVSAVNADDEKLWMFLPWKLGNSVSFPTNKELHVEYKHGELTTRKIFLAPYPYKIQGGELMGFAMAEKACRDAGTAILGYGGFRALLTTSNKPVARLLPRHMHSLPVVNLAGETLSESWHQFINGYLTNEDAKIISMMGEVDKMQPRWSWKYYWIGDGQGQTCGGWSSSYLMDVAPVITFDYTQQAVVQEISSCSASLNLLCYAVCDEQNKFI